MRSMISIIAVASLQSPALAGRQLLLATGSQLCAGGRWAFPGVFPVFGGGRSLVRLRWDPS